MIALPYITLGTETNLPDDDNIITHRLTRVSVEYDTDSHVKGHLDWVRSSINLCASRRPEQMDHA